MSTPFLSLSHIHFRIQDNSILSDVSCVIPENQITGLIGPSGAGKSTLLHLLLGYNTPDDGTIIHRDEDITTNAAKLRSMCGFASQHSSVYENLTVTQNMHHFGTLYGLSKKKIRQQEHDLFLRFGLNKHEHTLVRDLSGGQQRRLDLALSFIHDPEFIILDEPTSGLDPVLRANVWRYIEQAHASKKTILLTSHQLDEVQEKCHNIILLHEGKIVLAGTPQQVQNTFAGIFEVRIVTYPGNYKLIEKELRGYHLIKGNTVIDSHGLLFYTKKPEETLSIASRLFERTKQRLVDIRLQEPTLTEIFTAYTHD